MQPVVRGVDKCRQMLVRYILSSVCLRLSQFSQLYVIQYTGLCAFILPMWWSWEYVIYLIIVIKSEVWIIRPSKVMKHWYALYVLLYSNESYHSGWTNRTDQTIINRLRKAIQDLHIPLEWKTDHHLPDLWSVFRKSRTDHHVYIDWMRFHQHHSSMKFSCDWFKANVQYCVIQ